MAKRISDYDRTIAYITDPGRARGELTRLIETIEMAIRIRWPDLMAIRIRWPDLTREKNQRRRRTKAEKEAAKADSFIADGLLGLAEDKSRAKKDSEGGVPIP